MKSSARLLEQSVGPAMQPATDIEESQDLGILIL